MRFAETTSTGKLWIDAVSSRCSLRHVAGESRWQVAMQIARWLWLLPRQTRWLRALDARRTTRQAARTDPRLYERWHRPYISTHFDMDTRRRMVSAHYDFVMQRFPARVCQRLVQGYGVRMASLRLEGTSQVHLHLGKPSRGDDGEMSLLLLTDDKDVLASCILTFDCGNSVIIGRMQGAGAHTPFAATSLFVQGSHGLRPEELLMSLVRKLAEVHGLTRIRAVATSACIPGSSHRIDADKDDDFWREQGGRPTDGGCHELPLLLVQPACTAGSRSRREKRQRREAFRQQACDVFAAAFRLEAGSQRSDAATPSTRTPCRTGSAEATRLAPDRHDIFAAGF